MLRQVTSSVNCHKYPKCQAVFRKYRRVFIRRRRGCIRRHRRAFIRFLERRYKWRPRWHIYLLRWAALCKVIRWPYPVIWDLFLDTEMVCRLDRFLGLFNHRPLMLLLLRRYLIILVRMLLQWPWCRAESRADNRFGFLSSRKEKIERLPTRLSAHWRISVSNADNLYIFHSQIYFHLVFPGTTWYP